MRRLPQNGFLGGSVLQALGRLSVAGRIDALSQFAGEFHSLLFEVTFHVAADVAGIIVGCRRASAVVDILSGAAAREGGHESS